MNTRPRKTFWVSVLIASSIVGCDANHYQIEVKPTGETVQRTLTSWRERTVNEQATVVAFPEGELAKLATAYDAPVPSHLARRHKFVGVFAGEMPNDVGGSGSYTHWNTPLGSMSAYVERFRGNDDLLADVESRQIAADRFADLLIGWLTSELQGETGFAELSEFLEIHFRRDLKNLSLYVWAYGTVSDQDDAQSEIFVRAGQYLVERSYFTPDQLPALTRLPNGPRVS